MSIAKRSVSRAVVRFGLWMLAIGFLAFVFMSEGWKLTLIYAFIFVVAWATHQPWCPEWFREYLRN